MNWPGPLARRAALRSRSQAAVSRSLLIRPRWRGISRIRSTHSSRSMIFASPRHLDRSMACARQAGQHGRVAGLPRPATRHPVFSLYGEVRRPTAA
jgi:hypothetical protein